MAESKSLIMINYRFVFILYSSYFGIRIMNAPNILNKYIFMYKHMIGLT